MYLMITLKLGLVQEMTQTSEPRLKKKYRITSKLMEILDIINEAKASEGNFIWHQVDDKRHIFPVQITDYKIDSGKVYLAVENKSILFQVGQTLYLRFPSRDAVFKSRVHQLNDFELILTIPKEVLSCERRRSKRHSFHLTDEKMIQLKTELTKLYTVPTLDISEDGASVFIPKELKEHFMKNAQVTIDSIGDSKLNPPIPGKIVSQFPHVLNGQNTKENGYRIGISLEQSFPEAPFARFLIRPNLLTIDDERLALDSIFRNKVHETMDSTVKRLTTQRSTQRIFQKANFDLADPDYVKLHIKLLCEVLCGVGVKMGWVSEKNLDKLIYVAYMHDVYLLNKPHLAKIQSKQELDQMTHLSPEDRKMYLEAPLYAAELARLDQQSYPDVVKILIQQRELPDGSGFPYGVGSAQLTPLSCLFIFSHYFVDDMINHPDWTLEGFIKTYQRLLKGTYFSKILQTII